MFRPAIDNIDSYYAPAGAAGLGAYVAASARRSVRLIDLLGKNYSSSTDASAALTGFIAELAPRGIAIHDPDGMQVLLSSAVTLISGTVLHLSPATVLRKASATGNMFGTSLTTKQNGIRISGGQFVTHVGTETGDIFSLYGDGINLSNMLITGFRGRAALFAGDGIRMTSIRAISAAGTAGGNGGFRMLGGRNFVGTALHCECGDDVFQFVPSTSSGASLYNQDILDSYYVGCTGYSYAARLAVAAIGGPQDENAMTCLVRRVGFIGVAGKGGNRCFVVENSEGNGAVVDQVDDVLFSGCSFSGESETAETSQSGYIVSSFSRGVGRVVMNASTVHTCKRTYGVTISAAGSTTEMIACDISGESDAVQVTNGALLVKGGRYRTKAEVGGNAASHIITVTAGSAVVQDAKMEGLASSKGALRANASGVYVEASNVTIEKAAGASGTIGVSHATGSTVMLSGDVTGADTVQSGSGVVGGRSRVGLGADLTIASGSVTLTHPSHKIDTEGAAASDDLDTVVIPSTLMTGQIVTLRAKDTTHTVVIKDGTNIKTAGDFSLDNTEDVWTGMVVGTTLVEVSRSDNGA